MTHSRNTGFAKKGLVFVPLFSLLVGWSISVLLSACSVSRCRTAVERVDSLNLLSYRYWYKNLDTVLYLSEEAESLSRACGYVDGQAAARLNRSFVSFMRMDYEESARLSNEVLSMGSSQILLLAADVLMMRLTVRTSHIESFFFYRNSAQQHINRIMEDDALLSEADHMLFLTAYAGFHLASAEYYDGQELTTEVAEELEKIGEEHWESDTAVLLATLYLRGSSGREIVGHNREAILRHFDNLFRAYTSARAYGYKEFEGCCAEALAELFVHPVYAAQIRRERPGWWDYLYGQFVGWYDGQTYDYRKLSEALGRRALICFADYGDRYGGISANIGLGLQFIVAGDYLRAEEYLSRSLADINAYHSRYYPDRSLVMRSYSDSIEKSLSVELLSSYIYTVPELIARMREHWSVVFSARGDRVASDYNRNAYLDLLEGLRQDKETESRYRDLEAGQRRLLWGLLLISLSVVFWAGGLIWLFRRWNKGTSEQTKALARALDWCDACLTSGSVSVSASSGMAGIPDAFVRWVKSSDLTLDSLAERCDELRAEKETCELHLFGLKRRNLEKRAKFGLVYSLLPLVERLLNEVRRYRAAANYVYGLDYALELVQKINDDNAMLAGWIQLHRGEISLHVERFELNDVFDVVRKARQAFEQRGIAFEVRSTDLIVRADRALTLFMVNTLIDNARKFTPSGGHVTVWAEQGENYVEISVADDGEGLTPEECRMLSGAPVVDTGRIGHQTADGRKGHGFGLMNCRGIIEKYRKTNALFRVCLFGVESQKGKGSRFYFRLPGRGRTALLLVLIFYRTLPALADWDKFRRMENLAGQYHRPSLSVHADPDLRKAYAWADSLYFANLEAHYDEALACADSAFSCINHYTERLGESFERQLVLRSDDFLSEPVEVTWCDNGLDFDYSLLLGLRNETAVAALGRKDWLCYYYNNNVYTRLYKALGRDPQLASYCDAIVRSQANLRISIGLIVLTVILCLICFYMLYFRKRMMMKLHVRQVAEINKALIATSELLSAEDTPKQLAGMLTCLWEGMNEIYTVGGLRLLLLSNGDTRYRWSVGRITDEPVADSLLDQAVVDDERQILVGKGFCVRTLTVGLSPGEKETQIGALFVETDARAATETERLIDALIMRSFTLVVYKTVWLRVSEYDQIELARDERDRVRYEEDQLHVQNQVLDNCLSAIKHESMYYPSRVRQLLLQLTHAENVEMRGRLAEDLEEVICYYKEIYTILCEQAGRQLAVAIFKRRTFALADIFQRTRLSFEKVCRRMKTEAVVTFQQTDLKARGDEELVLFLLENLLAAALRRGEGSDKNRAYHFFAALDGAFVRVTFEDARPVYPAEEIRNLFVPDMHHIWYLLCRQIIREHDVYFNHCGCRIGAEPIEGGGVRIWFTIPNIES